MSRNDNLVGLCDWIVRNQPISKDYLIRCIMRDSAVSEITAKSYLDSVLAGIKGKPNIVNEFGIIKVRL